MDVTEEILQLEVFIQNQKKILQRLRKKKQIESTEIRIRLEDCDDALASLKPIKAKCKEGKP